MSACFARLPAQAMASRLAFVSIVIMAVFASATFAASPLPRPVERTLDNGLHVAVFPSSRLEMVQIQLLVPAGVTSEPKGQEGIAYATVEMLRRGTTSRDPQAFAAEVERLGGSITGSLGRDYATVSGVFLARDFESGMELVSDGVIYPVFDAGELRRVQAQALRQLSQRQQNSGFTADDLTWRTVFEGHPYARLPAGQWNPIIALDAERVRAFWGERYHPDHAVLAIAGDVTPERAFAVAQEWFGRWTGKTAAPPANEAPKARAGVRIRIIDRPGTDTELRLGLLAPKSGAPDEMALLAASSLLGGAPARRPGGERALFGREIRTGYTALSDAGLFSIACWVPSDSLGRAVTVLIDDVRKLHRPAEAADVAGVKRLMKNTFPMALETLASWTSSWLAAEFHGLGSDFFEHYGDRLDALSAQDIAGAAARWLDPARLAIVAVGPRAKLERQLAAFGKVEIARPDTSRAEEPRAAQSASAPATTAKPTAAQKARGRLLIAKMLAAHGGLDKLKAIKDTRIEALATLEMNGKKLEGNMVQARREPDRMVYVTEFGGVAMRQTLVGDKGWQLNGQDSTATALEPDNVVALKTGFGSDLHHLLLTAADPKTLVWSRGTEPLDTLQALAVVVESKGIARTYFLHPRTYRLIAFDQFEDPTQQAMRARRKFSDFQPVSGILWPYHEERLLNGERVMQVEVHSVRVNSGIPDAAFEMPSVGPKRTR